MNPDEIGKLIKNEIKNYENKIEYNNIGTVIEVGDSIARIYGLDHCLANELLEFENGEMGMALNLEEDYVSAVILGSDLEIKEGSVVKCTGKVVSVPVGESLIGRVVDALGYPIDG